MLARVKPAAMPATTSAPPRPLYNAVITVSELMKENSEPKIISDLPRIVLISGPSIWRRIFAGTKNGGLCRFMYRMKMPASTHRAMIVATAAPRTPRAGAPRFP